MDWTVTAACLVLVATVALANGGDFAYPETRIDDVVDEYHGVKVPDPYRWLEADVREAPEVARWIEQQNKLADSVLNTAVRDKIKSRLTELWNYEKRSTPFKVGARYCFFKNDGLQNQDVLYVQESLDGSPRVLLDPNGWSEDGTVALAGLTASDDGRYLAYGVADAGSDWRTWRVMEVNTQTVLADEVRWIKYGSVSWTKDGRGFFYSRYQEPEKGAEYQSLNFGQKVYYHRIGTPQERDVVVYQRPDQPEWGYTPKVTEDGRYLVITVWKGTDDKYRILYKDLDDRYAMPVDLIDNFDHEFTFVGNDGSNLYFITDWEAPRKRIVAIDVHKPERDNWRVIVGECKDSLQSARFLHNQLVVRYLEDACTKVRIYSRGGKHVRDLPLPGLGTAGGFGGRTSDTETFYSFSSIATPPRIYRYDMIEGESELLYEAPADFNADDYVVEQVFYPSKDGTKIPMFLVHRKDLKRDGSNPCLLYGYGGFAISLTPQFSIRRAAWLEMGGMFAMPNLRGGGEYGVDWHQAGTKLDKQNVFDDFIAAAQWLIDEKFTSPSKLAIQGRSNGGLLVGAAMTQRPDLFGACLPAVGVMDMLRFHKFTAGRFWVDDYGSADDPQQFEALRAYSPYHNVKEGTAYPATLVMTADTDDRVVPGHSFKFIAALQKAQSGDKPTLIRIHTRAGHGAGTPTELLIDETADEFTFLHEYLNME